jgi:hypothetical protein
MKTELQLQILVKLPNIKCDENSSAESQVARRKDGRTDGKT